MQIKIIAVLEVLGGIGVVLPLLVKRFEFLVPTAAICLALTMIVATIIHVQRGETNVPAIVLMVIALLVAWFRRDLFRRP